MSNTDTKRRSPAFPLYADDFLAGTADMTAEEVGAYMRLLCHQWSKGSIPADEERAGRMAGLLGSPSLRYVLAKFGPCDDGCLRNARLEQVRAEQSAFRSKQAESGRVGASKRWGGRRNDGDPISYPNSKPMATPLETPMANGCPPSPSPSPDIQRERDNMRGRDESWPKLADVKEVAAMRGVPPDIAEAFWNHFESQGWQTKDGLPIVRWQPKLASWWSNEQSRREKDRQKAAQRPNGYGRSPLPVSSDDEGF